MLNLNRTVIAPTVLEQPFASIADSVSSHAIFLLDKYGKIMSWNNGAQKISGWNAEDVLGKNLGYVMSGGPRAARKNLQLAQKNGAHVEESLWVMRNGRSFLADVTVHPVIGEFDGAKYIAIVKDTTVRRQTENDQIDANVLQSEDIDRRKIVEKALQESNQELDAFASAAGHDLQEPLRMVISYLQLIERRYASSFDEDGIEFLNFAVDGATRMKVLINDLVEYSRIETFGKKFKETDANDVLEKVLSSLEVSIAESGAVVTFDKLPKIWSDDVQLGELLQNLIANAIKFGRMGGKKPLKVHIGVKHMKNDYVFSVSDNGPGIDKKHFKTIFLIFKQLGNKRQMEGSGIGLAICKKIVTRHKGRLWVESDLGKGATFKFTVPTEEIT